MHHLGGQILEHKFPGNYLLNMLSLLFLYRRKTLRPAFELKTIKAEYEF